MSAATSPPRLRSWPAVAVAVLPLVAVGTAARALDAVGAWAPLPESVRAAVSLTFSLAAWMAITVAVAGRLGVSAAVGLVGVPRRAWAIGVGVGVMLGVLRFPLVWGLMRLGVVPGHEWVGHVWSMPGGPAWLWVAAVAVAPVAEEVLFRGVLFGWLSRWGAVVATTVSAVLFGIVHGELVVGLFATLSGVALGVLRTRSRSIWPGTTAHATINGSSVAVITALATVAAS